MRNHLYSPAESNAVIAYQLPADVDAIHSTDSMYNRTHTSTGGPHGNMIPGCSTTRLQWDRGLNMAASMDNKMFTMILEQYKKTKEVYKQQQTKLDKLMSAVTKNNRHLHLLQTIVFQKKNMSPFRQMRKIPCLTTNRNFRNRNMISHQKIFRTLNCKH